MSSGSNKDLKLLDQGLAAFVFEVEDGIPVLHDNPLLVAPWRDELEDHAVENVLCSGFSAPVDHVRPPGLPRGSRGPRDGPYRCCGGI